MDCVSTLFRPFFSGLMTDKHCLGLEPHVGCLHYSMGVCLLISCVKCSSFVATVGLYMELVIHLWTPLRR